MIFCLPQPLILFSTTTKFITSRGKMWMCGYADVAMGKMRRKMRIIREICMWLNGYFTSSAVIVVRRCPCLPSSAIVLVVHLHLSVCQKSAPLHLLAIISTDFLHKIYPQFTCCNIRTYTIHILPLPSRTGTLAEPKCHRSIVSISRHLRATVGVTTRLRNDL